MRGIKRIFIWIAIIIVTAFEMLLFIIASAFSKKFWRSFDSTYTLTIANSTDEEKEVTIFGANANLTSKNFGLPDGVSILLAEASYLELLFESQTMPFSISGFRVSSNNSDQISNVITIQCRSAIGQRMVMPIQLANYLSPFQFQSNVVDVPERHIIDGQTSFSFNLFPKASLIMVFFVAAQVNLSRTLRQFNESAPSAPSRLQTPAVLRGNIEQEQMGNPGAPRFQSKEGFFDGVREVWKDKVSWKKIKWLGDTKEIFEKRDRNDDFGRGGMAIFQ